MSKEDGYGLQQWGLDEWGSVGPSSLFPPITVTVTQITQTIIRFDLSTFVVVNDAYYDISNFTVTAQNGADPIKALHILPVNDIATTTLFLVTSFSELGGEYVVAITGLSTKRGAPVAVTGNYRSLRTKTDSLIRSVPSHYDARPGTIVSALLGAIGSEDSRIGGGFSYYVGE